MWVIIRRRGERVEAGKVRPVLTGPPCACGCGRLTRAGNRSGFSWGCEAKKYHALKAQREAA
jgi:hypothetical protein